MVFSDLFDRDERMLRLVADLRRRRHEVTVFHLLDPDELDFPFEGPTRFEGLEIPDHLACNPRALRDGYLAAVGEFLAEARRRTAAAACDYSLIRTGEPVDAALVKFLSRRASMAV